MCQDCCEAERPMPFHMFLLLCVLADGYYAPLAVALSQQTVNVRVIAHPLDPLSYVECSTSM